MKKVTKLPSEPEFTHKLRVAAYARVSTGKDAMLHSLTAQIDYYKTKIRANPEWIFAGVYVDEAKTGTKETREGLERLISDCRDGKIDMVLTKSISRFARNTVTLLRIVRMCKEWGVDIFFEEQSIHTISGDGELLLGILASYAQEESRCASENQKWRIKRNFAAGMPWNGALLGYRIRDGRYEIVPEEAEIVRRIYGEYLEGFGYHAIIRHLRKDSVSSRLGSGWGASGIAKILQNPAYTGSLLLQRYYRENHLTKKKLVNNGELPKYYAEDTHEAIIPKETFDAVQAEKTRRAARYGNHTGVRQFYPFTGKLVCAVCGKHYRRKVVKSGVVWICETFDHVGKFACASKQIPEETLKVISAKAMEMDEFAEAVFRERVESILVCNGNNLVFRFCDGTETTQHWQDRSRSQSWTNEMKEAARQRALERRGAKCQE